MNLMLIKSEKCCKNLNKKKWFFKGVCFCKMFLNSWEKKLPREGG